MRGMVTSSEKMLRTVLLVVLVHGAAIGLPQIAAAGDDAPIRSAIRNLDGPFEAGFEVLWRHPQRATEMLVAMIAPVRAGTYEHGRHPPVVWYLRALRSLTGLNFRGATKELLDEEEEHWLRVGADGSVEFFGTWMSRDRVWVAPEDAQNEIIRQWRQWFASQGNSHRYESNRRVESWYF
jgi:hypothetical protein